MLDLQVLFRLIVSAVNLLMKNVEFILDKFSQKESIFVFLQTLC